MHTYDKWIVWYKNGAAVHFTDQLAALARFGGHHDAVRMEHVLQKAVCSKPTRGYCGLCYPFGKNVGNPDYMESDAFIPASVLNT